MTHVSGLLHLFPKVALLFAAAMSGCASDSTASTREVKPPELSQPNPAGKIEPSSVIVEQSPSRTESDEPSSREAEAKDASSVPGLARDASTPSAAEPTKPSGTPTPSNSATKGSAK